MQAKPSVFLKYLLALLLFGSNGIVASAITLSSYEIVLLRTAIGSLFLWLVFLAARQKLTFWKHRVQGGFLAASGVAMGACWMFLYEAYQQIGVSLASLAYYCGPVIIMVLSPLLFREKLTAPKVGGFLVVLCGIVLVNGQAAQAGLSGWGIFCGLMSAVMLAAVVILNKKAAAIQGLENTMLQLTVSFVTVALFVGIKDGFAMDIGQGQLFPILLLGLVNTGVGCYLYFSSLGRLPAQTVAICGYLEPLAAVLFSVVFLGEVLSPVQILGAVLILGGAFAGACMEYLPLGRNVKI